MAKIIDVQAAKKALTGPVPSISTPFKQDGSIDYDSLRNLVDFAIEEGKAGTLLFTYGDSLFILLTDDEIAEVTKVVCEQAAGRAMVVAATGRWWTGKSVDFAHYAKSVGADVLMSLVPEWRKCTSTESIVNHYEEIGKVMPAMVVTSMAVGGASPLPLDSIKILLDHEGNNIVALKDDMINFYGRELATLIDGRWGLISGGKKTNHLLISPYGLDGFLSTYARFCPSIAYKYWDNFLAGNQDEAVKVIQKYEMTFFNDLLKSINGDFDLAIHASLEVFGIAERWRRAPFSSASDEQMEIVKAFFADLGLI